MRIVVPHVSWECAFNDVRNAGRSGPAGARCGRGFVFVEVSVVIEEYFRVFDDLARRLLC